MEYNYNELWKLLIDRNMSKKELSKLSGVSGATLARMKNNKQVTVDVLAKICEALDCEVNDIINIR